MGKKAADPTIRVLMLGAPGVGKNCLESRFTTMTYPPPYDPALTMNSRRFFTLLQQQQQQQPAQTKGAEQQQQLPVVAAVVQPVDTSQADAKEVKVEEEQKRPRTASSTYSNPASEHRTSPAEPEPEPDPEPAAAAAAVAAAAKAGEAGEAAGRRPLDDTTMPVATSDSSACSMCARLNKSKGGNRNSSSSNISSSSRSKSDKTYLVEVINNPTLQQERARAQVLGKGEYDAVMLVYDVASRESFDAVRALHAEIPICRRRNNHRRAASGARSSGHGWFGGAAASDAAGATGSGEIVVALVGNKSDFDAEYASVSLGLDGSLVDKEAEIQEADLEERSLVHPLFRESRFFDELNDEASLAAAGGRLSVASNAAAGRLSAMSNAAQSRVSVVSNAVQSRLSVVSNAVQSRLSVRGDDDEKEKKPAATGAAPAEGADRASVIETWLQTGSHVEAAAAETDEAAPTSPADITRIESYQTGSTTAAKRQVSRLDGEALARELMLQVPFFEASAKTGENVEDLFEATIREVLREMGLLEPPGAAKQQPCKHKAHLRHQQQQQQKNSKTKNRNKKEDQHAKPKDTSKSDAQAAVVVAANTGDGEQRQEQSDAAAADGEPAATTTAEAGSNTAVPAAFPKKVRRRESMMDRMRKVFMRKQHQQPAIVTDIAV